MVYKLAFLLLSHLVSSFTAPGTELGSLRVSSMSHEQFSESLINMLTILALKSIMASIAVGLAPNIISLQQLSSYYSKFLLAYTQLLI